MVVRMNALLTYRGRTITAEDLAFLQQLLADQPTLSRRALSQQVCQAWNWRQPNGVLKDAVCRGLLLRLHREGHLQLPAPRQQHTNRAGWHRRAPTVPIDRTPIAAPLADLLPLSFRLVRRTDEEPLFKALLHEHHELGYTQPVGEQLKYLVFSGTRVVAALAWSSAAHGLACRDRFLGWSLEAKRRNRHFLAYNSRFLIPPWIRVPHLASHVLGRLARRLSPVRRRNGVPSVGLVAGGTFEESSSGHRSGLSAGTAALPYLRRDLHGRVAPRSGTRQV